MIKIIFLLITLSSVAYGGLPPTTSKITGDSNNVTTFNFQFPNFTGTHTGTTVSLSNLSWAGGGRLAPSTVTTDTTMVAGNQYVVNDAVAANMTLPSSCSVGDEISIVGSGAGGWNLKSNAAAASQTFHAGAISSQTSSSSAITLVDTLSRYDCVTLLCIVANTDWAAINYVGLNLTPIVATGGTITTDGDYKVHTFTSSGTFQITSGAGLVDSLVVAGGGAGGGFGHGGGGGGGGLIYTTGVSKGIGSYVVTVGAGGTTGNPSTNGGNSVFDTITALGGGFGGGTGSAGNNGGSGGGAGAWVSGGALSGGTGTGGEGNNGGASNTSSANNNPGAGGGGCGSVGTSPNGTGTTAGNGGNGCVNSITGSAVTYAGGGGGGSNSGGGGTGGTGGGGAGSASGSAGGTAGTANTGGGGGGSGDGASIGTGNGGSGVVIVRYKFQ